MCLASSFPGLGSKPIFIERSITLVTISQNVEKNIPKLTPCISLQKMCYQWHAASTYIHAVTHILYETLLLTNAPLNYYNDAPLVYAVCQR